MIGKLKGIIEQVGADWLLLDVNGVVYHVSCSAKTLLCVPPVGGNVSLFTEMLVSQDMIRLIGFCHEVERDWFRLLQNVQGVGTRVALALLSLFTPEELGRALAAQDKNMISRAVGVGKKLAERIVVELKDKVPSFPAAVGSGAVGDQLRALPASDLTHDALSALVNLGYNRAQGSTILAAIMLRQGDQAPNLEQLVRLALKEISGR